ncbi:protein phosphatase 2C [Tritrichomonas foetus]|uniref:Protein phosphatase 2C n=1 Tax=Tritrichomonas foetus TaxID=1144522 RepID=A0A1J4JSH1_9EUKA|nr:protein phosphatase 2C [Tritrichomonas foetus]|eukprot:OHT00470.1 protein phosphatase 2C [Tritrichomonas foetus]
MRSQPVFRPSASLVLAHVPKETTEARIREIFRDYEPINNIVFHYITPNVFTTRVTVVLENTDAAKKFSTKFYSHKIPDSEITFHYAFRPFDCSTIHQQENVIQKPMLDEVEADFNPYTKNYFISDWNKLKEIPEIPSESILIHLRYNELTSFNMAFSALTTLNLVGNNLTSISPLTDFPSLVKLNVSHNFLEYFPKFTSKIKEIDASYNNIVDIDDSIKDAISLKLFNASHNKIKVVPELPPNLVRVNFSDNEIERLMPSTLKELVEMSLSNNKLTEVPDAFQNKLSTYCLRMNAFTHFDVSLFIFNIREINLCMCNLTEFPASAFQMRSLSKLVLYGNKITEIPNEFSSSHITSLDLSLNPVSVLPPVPMHMMDLRMSHCKLTDVCSSIPDTNSIRYFYVDGNQITKLPKFNRIEELFASSNLITEFPTIQASSNKKVFLDLSHNQIQSIPYLYLNKINFALFDVSFNPIVEVPLLLFNTKSTFSFCGIKDLELSLTQKELSKIAFLNMFDTKIQANREPNDTHTIVRTLTNDSDLTDVDTYFIECDSDTVGFSDTIGKRPTMEDAMVIRQHFKENEALFGLFDGHGGPIVSKLAAASFPGLCEEYDPLNKQAVLDVCAKYQDKMVQINESSGSTMEFVVLIKDPIYKAIISHIGDSKTAIFDKNGNVRYQNMEQRPDLRCETERLRSEKVTIRRMRTAGILAMSRSLGDVQVRGVSHVPTQDEVILTEEDKWLVIACDGVWDDVDIGSAGKIVAMSKSPMEAAAGLRNAGFSRGSDDNISAIVVDLETVFKKK